MSSLLPACLAVSGDVADSAADCDFLVPLVAPLALAATVVGEAC